MYNIQLICTVHQSCGRCNAGELYNIIASIKPDIIFEELSCANFHKSYQEERLITVETNAIKMYRLGNAADHIPVDTFDLPRLYEEDRDRMYDRIFGDTNRKETQDFIRLIKHQEMLTETHGFPFLNSEYHDKLYEQFYILKRNILQHLNDKQLFQIDKLDKEVLEKREDEMLNNIYRYSQEHPFSQGLFFIGSGHRQSVLRKIDECNEKKKPKLNWSIWTA